jgi:hypothetical protein
MRARLCPLEAYDRAALRRQFVAGRFRGKIALLHRRLVEGGLSVERAPSWLHGPARARWPEVSRAFVAAAPPGDVTAIGATYATLAMRYGVVWLDPNMPGFRRAYRVWYREYVTNFPLPEEQETRSGFRELWRASPREGGYQEIACGVHCPLTGRFLAGLNFTIQPRSDTVHFIYGFVNPAARGFGGLSRHLIQLMREEGRKAITQHFLKNPDERPPFHDPDGPLIVFEKNIIEEMSLTEILRDSAGVDIDRPPTHHARQEASAMSQSERDAIWDHHGGRVVDYHSIQSSLDGVVRVPDAETGTVIAFLNDDSLEDARRLHAERLLNDALDGRLPGCLTLNLCVFVAPGLTSVPAVQIRRSNEIFQGISVVKDPAHLHEDIYFQAQMTSLAAREKAGRIALRRIAPCGPGVTTFAEAEALTRRLLGVVTWDELRAHPDRPYGAWLRLKASAMMAAA